MPLLKQMHKAEELRNADFSIASGIEYLNTNSPLPAEMFITENYQEQSSKQHISLASYDSKSKSKDSNCNEFNFADISPRKEPEFEPTLD